MHSASITELNDRISRSLKPFMAEWLQLIELLRKAKNMTPFRTPLLTVALLASTGSGMASEGIDFKLSGFGTIGAVVTDTDEMQYRQSRRQSHGATKEANFGVDSRLGVQANLKLNDTFSAVGQLLAIRRLEGDRPVVEWLYAQAEISSGLSLKLGRMVLPQFMLTDSLAANISQHWLRAPTDVYGAYSASSFDGGQLQYRGSIGAVNLTAQVSKGSGKADMNVFAIKVHGDMPDILSLNLVAEVGDWQFRFGKSQAKDLVLKELRTTLTDNFTGVGLQFDNGQALMMAEYVIRRQPAEAFDSDGMYVSAGWRFGSILPYATYSKFKPKGKGFAPGSKPTDTSAVGLKWDFMRNLALKAQIDHTMPSIYTQVNATPAFAANPYKINVYSVAVDFAF